MRLIEPYDRLLSESLAEHRRWAEKAAQSNDLDDIRGALNACWSARIRASELIRDGEAETKRVMLANLERAAA